MTQVADGVKIWKLMKAPKSHWSNIPQYDHTSMSIGPFIDSKSKQLKTGLTKEDAERLAPEIGLEAKDLYPHGSYWKDFQIKIGSEIQRLDLADPQDEINFLFLKAHKLVAFGHGDLKRKASALFVLYNDVDQAKAQVRTADVKIDAYAKLKHMTTEEMIDILMVMGKPVVSSDPSIIKAMMSQVVEKEAAKFLDISEDKDFKMKTFVLKCVHYDVLSRSRGRDWETAIFSFNEDVIGEGLTNVVKILERKANQQLYLALQKRLDMAVSAGTLAGAPIITGYAVEEAIEAEEKKKVVKGERKITSKAAKGRTKEGQSIADSNSIKEVSGDGTDSGEYGVAPETL
jgi:hypothetical protein